MFLQPGGGCARELHSWKRVARVEEIHFLLRWKNGMGGEEEEERWREAQMRPDVYFDRQNSWTRPKVNRSAELVLISCRGTLGDVPAYRRFLSCCFNLYLFLVVFLPTWFLQFSDRLSWDKHIFLHIVYFRLCVLILSLKSCKNMWKVIWVIII